MLETRRSDLLGGRGGARDSVSVLENGDKLQVVDASRQSSACLQGLRHPYVRAHREQGASVLRLDFIHPELFQEQGSQRRDLRRSYRP